MRHRTLALLIAPLLNWAPLPAMAEPGRTTSPTIIAATDALKAEIAKQRVAHLGADADLLVGLFSEDFTSIDNGVVSRPTRAESRARFKRYFDAVVFRAWDDIAPPQITLSADGTMATVVVSKLVRLADRAQATNPDARISETRFAWLETWRREGQQWRLFQIASTRSTSK